MEDKPWLLGLLCTIGLALFFIEIFIPSAGLIGAAGLVCVVYSIWNLFAAGYFWAGSIAVAMSILYTSALVVWAVRRITSRTDLGSATATGADVEIAGRLIGASGEAKTDLRPAGVAAIEGRRFDVVTRGEFVEAGATVEVIETQGNRIVVKSA